MSTRRPELGRSRSTRHGSRPASAAAAATHAGGPGPKGGSVTTALKRPDAAKDAAPAADTSGSFPVSTPTRHRSACPAAGFPSASIAAAAESKHHSGVRPAVGDACSPNEFMTCSPGPTTSFLLP
ncbi:hypothetical protein ACFPM0_36795 [Pseudonocardia sulfidoxydans]|uniref:hypothetical protein n=1 Tax=Pseudonocardia sulfidoxydans TaxID=54011 RepID=UPI00360E801D